MPQSLIRDIIPGIDFKDPPTVELKATQYEQQNISVSMLRLDEIHPVISGNKLFKLYYFLEEAKNDTTKKIITFGGAYSNHLAATAFACSKSNVQSMAFVRGEKPKKLSPTLSFCIENKMKLEFLSREDYTKINEGHFLAQLKNKYGEFILVPEGGFSIKGTRGAALITQFYNDANYTHVCLAVGTATTFAGIINGSNNSSETIGLGVLKNMHDINKRLGELQVDSRKKYSFNGDYHFGGYAKKTRKLIDFINNFYVCHKIPLDFVYTGKMMFGVNDLIQKNYFPPHSKILCIHTGGLQGNNSLGKGVLNF